MSIVQFCVLDSLNSFELSFYIHTNSDIEITNLSDDSKSCRIHSHRSNPRIESESNGWFFFDKYFSLSSRTLSFLLFRLLFLLLLIFFKRWNNDGSSSVYASLNCYAHIQIIIIKIFAICDTKFLYDRNNISRDRKNIRILSYIS